VLLEVAYFDRASIRQTSRKLGLATEASYRFERGVDIENLKRASDRATELICELAGGEAGEFVDVYPTRQSQNEVDSKDISSAVKRLTGLDVPAGECDRILNALGILLKEDPEPSDIVQKTYVAPTWRHDIAIEEDLVEEVARHAGYESIKDELPPAYGAGEYQATEVRKKLIRRTLADLGFDEAIGYSFIDTRHDGVIEEVPELTGGDSYEPYVTLQDSVIEGAVRMRTTLLPGLLDAVRLNFNHQRRDLKLFELGRVFSTGNGDLPKEREVFGIVVTGGQINEGRSIAIRELDFFDAKGALESALEVAGATEARFDAEDVKHLRRGQSASVTVGERKVGFLGRLSEEIAANYKFKQPVYVGEIDLQAVLEQSPEPVRYAPLPKYPSVVRDVSFVVDRGTAYESIKRAAVSGAPSILRSVDFVDVYEGKGLGDDERSLTIRFSYRADDRTLVEEEVNEAHQAILGRLEEILGIRPRN
jgi:phenylalanyl-tRNA synthetase beta chain